MMGKKLEKKEEKLNTLEFISHELKGILGSTIMCIYSIRQGFLGMINFKQKKTLDTAIRNLRRLEATIKDYMDFSKIEDESFDVKKTEINLNEDVIREIKDVYMAEIFEKNMVFENRVPRSVTVKADKTLMGTVYNNLVGNAVKYGSDGGRIILDCEEFEDNIRLSVYNDGIPIKKDDKKHLFKKFHRIESEQYKDIKGTGLGLFIVKKIIENFGGNIWHEPKEQGNEFIFEIEKE